MSEDNKRLARRYFDDLLNEGRIEAVDEIMSEDCVLSAPVLPQEFRGAATFKQVLTGLRAVFPDLRFVVHEEIGEGDRVATTWTMTGTHSGEWLGVAATGRRLTMTGCDILRIDAGRVVRIDIQADYLGALRQMGAA